MKCLLRKIQMKRNYQSLRFTCILCIRVLMPRQQVLVKEDEPEELFFTCIFQGPEAYLERARKLLTAASWLLPPTLSFRN